MNAAHPESALPASGPSNGPSASTLAVAQARAVAVLEANWNGSHTLPATGLYPHQWSWDSAFIAIGLRHVSPRRAGQELDSLLAGQWSDGRIPQIIFDPHRDTDYSPGSGFWQSRAIPGSPADVDTAGLIQPPNHAWAVWKVHVADPAESRRRSFLERAYPRLVAWHEYLRTRRDRGGRGLASIVHPWESGTDNSPLWDDVLATVPGNPRHVFERPDLMHAHASERPSDREYGKYFWLAERYRDHDCDDRDEGFPFLLEDPLFNSLYAVSELALASIAEALGLPSELHRERAADLASALSSLYSPDAGTYGAYDVVSGSLVQKATVNGLLPLLVPGIEHADELLATLLGERFLGTGALLVPSYDSTAADFDPGLYWRGPAWFNMAWLSAVALARHGRMAEADRLGAQIVRLAAADDFPEYVQPWTGNPHGTRRFSWTAALALDVMRHEGWGVME
ncbi:hypothetical protein ACEXQE_08815 [Herbiconiux sp. P17]|uniref:MGH1-like glycoside hydrolase domain-containing protein n=1 Tax=Herbiconiux wuyangfengii TaxID=3342794 RepID=UPI0035B7BE5B